MFFISSPIHRHKIPNKFVFLFFKETIKQNFLLYHEKISNIPRLIPTKMPW
jgi:hypothetical protein